MERATGLNPIDGKESRHLMVVVKRLFFRDHCFVPSQCKEIDCSLGPQSANAR